MVVDDGMVVYVVVIYEDRGVSVVVHDEAMDEGDACVCSCCR